MKTPYPGISLRSIFLFLFLAVALYAEAQGPWAQCATMPGPPRHRGFTFTIGQRGYFGCGWNGVTMYGDFWEYDPGTDSWIQRANYPGGARLSPFGFAIGNKGYAGTGLDASLWAQPDFYEYNPATNQWTQKASFNGSPVFGSTTDVYNGKGYVFFGDEWAPNYWKHNEVYKYDPVTNAWSYVSAFPGDGRRDAVGYLIGNKFYIGTGNDNNYMELNDWWEFNPATGAWSPKAPFIGSARSQAVGFAISGKGYLGTGGLGDERDFFEYTPLTNSWQGIDEFGGSGRENAMSFVIGTRAYIIAGTSGINYNDTWSFNPSLVTDVNQEMQIAEVKIWPNPATDFININLEANFSGEVDYQIYSISGQIVTHSDNVYTGDILQIPVNQMANGEYFVVVSSENCQWKGHFIH